MNANQPILESDELPRVDEDVLAFDNQPSEPKPLRLLQGRVLEGEPKSDSFKKTANLFGRALSALFR